MNYGAHCSRSSGKYTVLLVRSKAAAHSFAALAYLLSQCFSNRVFDSSPTTIQEDRIGNLWHATADKRLGKSGVFGQLFEICLRHLFR